MGEIEVNENGVCAQFSEEGEKHEKCIKLPDSRQASYMWGLRDSGEH